MKFGLCAMNLDGCSYPATMGRVAREAEAAGFESLWAGEHVVAPDPRSADSPLSPTDRSLDPLITLTYLAASTSRVLLGTGVVILPQRQPLVLAKQLASLDSLSDGRLVFGIGAGYLRPEMEAIGVPFHERGARTDEFLAAMRAIWSRDAVTFDGRFVSFKGISAHPRRSTIPIVVGGRSAAAYRRAIRSGNGWYGFGLDLSATEQILDELREVATRTERPASLGPLEISVTPRGRVTRDLADRFAELGVDRLILLPSRRTDEAALLAYVADAQAELLG